MKPSLFLISSVSAGRLFIMPKPSGEWLQDDMASYRSNGIDVVVSLLEPAEARELGLSEEAKSCALASMRYCHFPIPDRGVPQVNPFAALVDALVDDLLSGKGVAVHCRAGIGRSGMLACCILVRLGDTIEAALGKVSEARGVDVPDTEEQLEFIERYANNSLKERVAPNECQ